MALPREMLVEFSKVVQALTESLDREVRPDEIFEALKDEYLVESGPYRLIDYYLSRAEGDAQHCTAKLEVPDGEVAIVGEGSGPIEAFVNGMVATLNEPLNIIDYHERAMGAGKDASAICIVAIGDAEIASENGSNYHGIGISQNTITAALIAIVSAVNRRWKR